jgi:thioredoxin reductase (NADPH)
MIEKIYDLIIIGGGPAGLSAAIYARRAHLETLLIEKGPLGGQIFQTAEIENYPGGLKGESGEEFCKRLAEQAASFGYERAVDEVRDLCLEGAEKIVVGGKASYRGRTLIIATGNVPMPLGVPGESDFAGRGVSYCATCDAPFFTGLAVYVVGGGDAAVEEALHLAKFARQVTIIHRRNALRAAKSIQHKAEAAENVDFLLDTIVREIRGGDLLDSIVVENVKTGERQEIKADETDGTMGLFIFVGSTPQTAICEGKIQMEHGYILTDEAMGTDISGVYAAGDLRKKSLRQVVTAAADGAIAAVSAERFLLEKG